VIISSSCLQFLCNDSENRLLIYLFRQFGGDPERITIFGQSAGGGSVDYYSYAWTKDPIVNGFILQSGAVFSFGQASKETSAFAWYNATTKAGCGDSTSNQDLVLSCMRSKNYTEVLNAIKSSAGGLAAVLGSYGPTVDEKVVFSDYQARSEAGNFIRRPMLIGNADYEAGLFKILSTLANQTLSDQTWDLFDLNMFTCSASQRAAYHIRHGVPTWRYRWFGHFPNTDLTVNPSSGAWHGSELAPLFGFTNLTSSATGINDTAPELEISSYIRKAWGDFAKYPSYGLSTGSSTWPRYLGAGHTLARIGINNQTGTNLGDPGDYDYLCPFIAALGGATAASDPITVLSTSDSDLSRLFSLSRDDARTLLTTYPS
jgi:cholinesterase